MKIMDFYVIPETKMDDSFIEDEIKFLLDVSIKRRDEIRTMENYKRIVLQRFNDWQSKALSFS